MGRHFASSARASKRLNDVKPTSDLGPTSAAQCIECKNRKKLVPVLGATSSLCLDDSDNCHSV